MTEAISPIARIRPIAPISNDFSPLNPYDKAPYTPQIETLLSQELHRPELIPPGAYQTPPFQELIVKFVESLTSIESNYLDTIELRLQDTCQAYHKDQKQMLTEERNIEKKMEKDSWAAFIHRISLSLLGAVSIIAATSLLGAATTAWEVGAAIALMTSSASSILGAALIDSHPELTTALTITSAAMSVLGGGHLVLHGAQTTTELAGNIAMATFTIMGHFAGLTKEALGAEVEKLKASHGLVDASFEKHGIQMQNLEKDLGFFSEQISESVKTCAMIQYKKEQSLRKILADIGPA